MFFDQQNVFIGNPQLNPEYTDAFELGLSKSGAMARFSCRRSIVTPPTSFASTSILPT